MNPFRDLPHPAQRLKPVKKMLLQKLIDLIVVVELFTTLLKMLDPVETCVLDPRRKPFMHSTALHISHENTWSAQVTDILLKRGRHELYAGIGQRPVPLFLIYPQL